MTHLPLDQWAVEAGSLCSHMVKGSLKVCPTGTHGSSSKWSSFPLVERVTAARGHLLHMLLGCCGEFIPLLSKIFCELWTSWVSSDLPFQTCLFLVSYHLLIVLKASLQNVCSVIRGWLATTKRFEPTA